MEGFETHELERHKDDEIVISALFGSKRSEAEGGGRHSDEGLMKRMSNVEKKRNGLAAKDRLLIAALIFAAEAVRIWNG